MCFVNITFLENKRRKLWNLHEILILCARQAKWYSFSCFIWCCFLMNHDVFNNIFAFDCYTLVFHAFCNNPCKYFLKVRIKTLSFFSTSLQQLRLPKSTFHQFETHRCSRGDWLKFCSFPNPSSNKVVLEKCDRSISASPIFFSQTNARTSQTAPFFHLISTWIKRYESSSGRSSLEMAERCGLSLLQF